MHYLQRKKNVKYFSGDMEHFSDHVNIRITFSFDRHKKWWRICPDVFSCQAGKHIFFSHKYIYERINSYTILRFTFFHCKRPCG
jgi:hypothetical protein